MEASIELEAKRKEDHSWAWHPCQVSLSSGTSSGSHIIVDFGSSNSEDVISSKEEALARLRVRSTPLQDGECFHIKEGDHILAMHKTRFRSLFFDAEVEKVWRVRHSNRVHCRCSFEVRWLQPELKGETMTVSSNSIRKLARKSIESHPMVASFLKSVAPLNCSDIPLDVAFLEDNNCETDLQKLLENQIEEIGKLADGSHRTFSNEILLGVKKVDHIERTGRKMIIASQTTSLHGRIPENQNNFRRSTRIQSKQVEMEQNDPPHVQPTLDEHFEKRPCLNPLAARAALASLMHELPQRPEISIYHMEEEGYVDPSQNTPQHIGLLSLDLAHTFINSDVCIQKKVSMNSDTFQESVQEPKLPIPSKRASSKNSPFMVKSYGMLTKQEKPSPATKIVNDRNLDTPTVMRRFTRSAVARLSNSNAPTTGLTHSNSNKPSVRNRLTRSSVQKDKGKSPQESLGVLTKQEITPPMAQIPENSSLNAPTIMTRVTHSVNDWNSNSTTITTRLTRSEIKGEMGSSVNKLKQESSSEARKFDGPTITTRVTRSAMINGNSTNKVKLESSEDRKLNGPTITTRLTRSAVQKETVNSDGVKIETLTRNRKLNIPTSPTRLTRLAIQKEKGNSIANIVEEFATLKSRKTQKKSSLSSPVDIERNASLLTKKRLRVSTTVIVIKDDEGGGEGRQAKKQKVISSKKPQLRFSPRLRFLPRTRSGKKSSHSCWW
ncbi:uncharacterized protein LOC143848176 isoform X2 [Tasmannia lanceolata]|uniref:uncharacterized protein LOC143848176 isoform X2 n=1 Tax=Tasmannia lanceolata TaxID=3420 RepID=UPI004063458C